MEGGISLFARRVLSTLDKAAIDVERSHSEERVCVWKSCNYPDRLRRQMGVFRGGIGRVYHECSDGKRLAKGRRYGLTIPRIFLLQIPKMNFELQLIPAVSN